MELVWFDSLLKLRLCYLGLGDNVSLACIHQYIIMHARAGYRL